MGSLHQRAGSLLVLGMLLCLGCGALDGAARQERRVPLAVLYQGSQCGGAGPAAGAAWIDRPEDLPSVISRWGGYPWNPEDEGALWVRMGAQPTGGFGLELANPTAGLRKGVATVQITWKRPSPDRFVTQAFTSPCMLLRVPRAGIETIQVVDQEGRQRAQVQLP